MKRLFLLDAYAIIYRAYYALIKNPRVNSKGFNTSAIMGFVNTLEEVLTKEKPTHIAVAFDPKGPTFRHEAYPEYKAQRESTPEDIKKSVPYIKDILKAYQIPILEVSGFEADDVIGTLAKKGEEEGFEVYMLTSDKDYGQLVSDKVFMYRPKFRGGYDVLGASEIKERYDLVSHTQVIDLLGLMGDASDNIPGCPGVGEKTAIKLLNEFGSIDNLLENTAKLKGALKKNVEENREQIKFSQFLATIRTDVPVDFDAEQMAFEEVNEDELRSIFEELEFRTLLNRKFNTSSTSTKKTQTGQMSLFGDENEDINEMQKTNEKEETLSSSKYHLVDTDIKRRALITQLAMQKSISFDTETTSINPFEAQLVGLSFAFAKGEAYFVPTPPNREECLSILQEFKAIFMAEHIEKIAQNMKYDILVLAQYGVELKGKLFDTMLAHYILQPELRHGMDYMADVYLNYKTISYDDLFVGVPKSKQDILKVDQDLLKNYACEDADITFQLKQILAKELVENNLEPLFYNMEMPLMQVLAKMEINGVLIDVEALKESSEILTKDLLKIEQHIKDLAGVEFNVGSPMQVGEVLFDHLKLDEKAKKTKTGQYSTAEDILEKLKSKHPIVDEILKYRGLRKLLSTYIDALPQMVNSKTNHIHTSYNQAVAATGRLSSTNPNLQNIPVRDEQGREIRKAFIPEPGWRFMSVDYSQIELRIMAHLSGDETMIEAFNSGQDIHAATSAKIYKVALDEVTSDMRRKAKTANFGIIYGISTFGLAERLSIPRAEAKELIDGYFATYPGVKSYMDGIIQKAKEQGYVETIYGRKRYLSDINSQNAIVRGFAERNAINAPIQGSAADIIKLAMIEIQNKLEENQFETKMTMQVHDELNFSVPESELDLVKKMVVDTMQQVLELKVPLIAEVGVGDNWLEAH